MTSIISSATSTTADAAHAAAASILSATQITSGSSIPAVSIKEIDPGETFTLHNLPGRNIILGVPGAFTPSCSGQVPEYISKFKDFQDKGVLGIYVVSVNDVFVMKAWKDSMASDAVRFIADDRGAFNSALGLIFDATKQLGGPRAKRYALVVDDGKVAAIYVEKESDQVTTTAASSLLKTL